MAPAGIEPAFTRERPPVLTTRRRGRRSKSRSRAATARSVRHARIIEHMFVRYGHARANLSVATAARRLRREEGMPMKRIATRLGVSRPTSVTSGPETSSSTPSIANGTSAATEPQNPERVTPRSGVGSNRREATRVPGRGRAAGARRRSAPQAGCMLYWAEGARSRNAVIFANSDLNMVRFFRRFLARAASMSPPKRFALQAQRLHEERTLASRRSRTTGSRRWTCPGPCFGGTRSITAQPRAAARRRTSCRTASAPVASCGARTSSSTSTVRSRSTRASRSRDGSMARHASRRTRGGRPQPSSSSSSAFCAWRRFSAWSQTAERSP